MKPLLGLALAALLTTTLAGCGGDDDQDDAAEARTIACRAYALDTVGDRAEAVDELRAADQFEEWDSALLSVPVARLGAAAVRAGNVPDLAETDYAVFLALVTASRAVDTMIHPNGSDTIDLTAGAETLDTAALAVEKLCN